MKYLVGGIGILRVVSGIAKGHNLKTLKGDNTRPTSDRVKEALFNIISQQVADRNVLDLFAGTGNLGIEALSRGARSCVFVDRSNECKALIYQNLCHTKLVTNAEIITNDVFASIEFLSTKGMKFDLIFLDPPYNRGFINKTLLKMSNNEILLEDALIVVEHEINDDIFQTIENIELYRSEKYGKTMISFYKLK